MIDNLEELRDGLALLVCNIKTRAVGVREDGTEITVGPRVFADLDDDLYEAMNWCVLNQVRFTRPERGPRPRPPGPHRGMETVTGLHQAGQGRPAEEHTDLRAIAAHGQDREAQMSKRRWDLIPVSSEFDDLRRFRETWLPLSNPRWMNPPKKPAQAQELKELPPETIGPGAL